AFPVASRAPVCFSVNTSLRKTWHHSRETQHAHDHHRPRIARDRFVARSRTDHDHADADTDTDWADDTVDRVAVPDRAISRGIVDGDAHTDEPDTEHHDARCNDVEHHDARHDEDSERHDRGDNDANRLLDQRAHDRLRQYAGRDDERLRGPTDALTRSTPEPHGALA